MTLRSMKRLLRFSEFTFLSESFKNVNLGGNDGGGLSIQILSSSFYRCYFPAQGKSIKAEKLLNWEQQGAYVCVHVCVCVCVCTHTQEEINLFAFRTSKVVKQVV